MPSRARAGGLKELARLAAELAATVTAGSAGDELASVVQAGIVRLQDDDIHLGRTIAEELAELLMHMVRSALNHGIGTPLSARARASRHTRGC